MLPKFLAFKITRKNKEKELRSPLGRCKNFTFQKLLFYPTMFFKAK
jgi:hypothetical protein